LDRYVAGECEAVWSELVAPRASSEDEDTRAEAQAVANETVDRARRNLQLLHERLLRLGYDFARPNLAFVEANDRTRRHIDEVERRLGGLPILIRTWYERIASVDFSQSRRQCCEMPGHPFGNLGWYPHMMYLPLDECLERSSQLKHQYEEWYRTTHDFMQREGLEATPPSERKPFLPIGGYASNCEPKGVELPNPAPDGVLFDDGGGPVYFNQDIREGFRFGGFPQLAPRMRNKWVPELRHPDPGELLSALTEGMLPL